MDVSTRVFLFFILIVISRETNSDEITPSHPNILLVLVDDLGYGDLGCYGNETVESPNIDRLANEGVRFTRMYSHATCTPSRASLLTGRLPVRQGLMKGNILPFDVLISASSDAGLPLEETTVAEILRSHGYDTAMFGKWHLGLGRGRRFLPTNHGFDYFYGTLFSHGTSCMEDYRGIANPYLFGHFVMLSHKIWITLLFCVILLRLLGLSSSKTTAIFVIGEAVFCVTLYGYIYTLSVLNPSTCLVFRNKEIIEQPYRYENLTLRYTNEAISFMNQSVHDGNPFFVYLAYNKMHSPIFVSRTFRNITGRGIYQDGLVELDWSFGEITNFLRRRELENNTIVILLSDNGPQIHTPGLVRLPPVETRGSAGTVTDGQGKRVYLRGHKTNNWEGGIRIPCIIKWTGKIPEGRTVDVTASLMDILPTILELLQLTYPGDKSLDGRSLVPLLTSDPSLPSPHQYLFHYCDMTRPGAVTYGRYKVHFMHSPSPMSCSGVSLDPPLMFDIVDDPGESRPLKLDKYTEVISDINRAVERHLATRNIDGYPSSQYDYMMWPWLFPCVNFPFCRQTWIDTDDEVQ